MNKFEKWENEFRSAIESHKWLMEKFGLMKEFRSVVKLPVVKFSRDMGRAYDKVEPFQILRLAGLGLLRHLAILPGDGEDEFLVVPCSPYHNPASSEELKAVKGAQWHDVFQLWNTRTMSSDELKGFVEDKLDPQDAENIRLCLAHTRLGKGDLDALADLLGEDPETEEGKELLQQYIEKEIENLDNVHLDWFENMVL